METVLVVNCGSSSVKLDVFTFPNEDNPLSLLVERVGKDNARMKVHGEARAVEAKTPAQAVGLALDEAARAGFTPVAVGHRVVHGGERFQDSVRIDDDVVAAIKACVPLAPLHNPANLAGIEVARARLNVPHVAVFDTAFHQTLPPESFLYALPRQLYEEQKVRRYGFHGTSHRYVAERAAAMMGKPLDALRMITLHLGNGCSACAIDAGRSVDTSMGLTPLEGLVMGTRCGDVDPAVVASLARTMGVEQAEELLNKKSGLLGLSKRSNDMRDLEQHASAGDEDADLAIKVFSRRARKYVGAYAAVLGGVDAIVFTGGIGENSVRVRREVCEGLGVVGALLDQDKNGAASRDERDVATDGSRARILVIPTDEERVIARDALRLMR